jgi:hypothetical protein
MWQVIVPITTRLEEDSVQNYRVVAPLAVVGFGGLIYAAIAASMSTAQAQQNQPGNDLNAKVERLEQQVKSLQKEIEQLKRHSVTLSLTPSSPFYSPEAGKGSTNTVPPEWKVFPSNGQNYYMIPVDKGSNLVHKGNNSVAVRNGQQVLPTQALPSNRRDNQLTR